MKKLISVVLCLTFLLGTIFSVPELTANAVTVDVERTSSNQNNIVNRANYMYNAVWTCQQTVQGWGSTFYTGNRYRVPYGQPVYSGQYIGYTPSGTIDDSTVTAYVSAANTAGSVFYTGRSHCGGTTAPHWATDCSAFVSWCWGISRTTTYGIPNVSSYIGEVSVNDCTYNLQLGDALNDYDSHIVLVTDLAYDGNGAITQIEITEQTPPQLKKSYYTPKELSNKYFGNYSIYRYNGNVPVAPNAGEWEQVGQYWRYRHLDGTYAKDWEYIDGEWYYFSGSTYMYTGWLEYGGKLYMLNPKNGIMQRGWFKLDGIWYFFDNEGAMVTGWIQPRENGAWYYLNSDGEMVTGWNEIDGITYYFDTYSGAMATEWELIDNVWHHFNADGVYLNSTNVDMGDSFIGIITTDMDNTKALSLCGNNVQLRTADGEADQNWNFVRQKDGSYKIINQSNGWCLDVQDASVSSGANVQTWADNGSDAQKWIFTLDEGCSGYTLRPVNGLDYDKVLDVLNAESTDGTNVVISRPNKRLNQQFSIIIPGEKPTEDTTEKPIENPDEEPITQNIAGDANKDGKISISDVTYIQKVLAEIIPTPEDISTADVTGSGDIDVRDITYLQMYIVKIIGLFPCEA